MSLHDRIAARPGVFASVVLPAAAWLAAASGAAAGGVACECEAAWLEMGLRSEWVSDASRGYAPATGEDLKNYAPDRRVDLDHMKLTLEIPDMNTPRMNAVEELTFSPIGKPVEVLELDAVGFELGEVTGMGGADVAGVEYDGERIAVRFAAPIEPGQAAGVRIEYTVNDPYDGLFWTPQSEAWGDRPAQIHTQGQPETNRHWFASHDFPNERMTTEIIATVPEGFLVSANGRLVSEETSGGETTFHWLQDTDHPAYLVSLVAGEFDVVDVGTSGLPMPVYVPPGRAGDVERTYGMTADMVEVFEDRFGEPYPWDRYAQLVVHNFGAGGMENTSATTMYGTAIYSEKDLIDDDLEGLIAHELGHQWFGDLLTCTSWADIWLNEGFATYSTSLWYEARDGYDEGYLRQALANFDRFSRRDALDPDDERAGLRPAMVSRVYEHPWDVFRRRANPYPKGSTVLHMLRMKLGDEAFFAGLAEYVDRHKHSTVETPDFRQALEDVSGLSLDRFFQQWVHRPGVPELDFKASYDAEAGELRMTLEQTQRVDEFVPAFVFDLPVEVTTDRGRKQTVTFRVDSTRHERVLPLDRAPAMVAVDPELSVLSRVTLDVPESWLVNQLRSGPTLPSRILAARALEDATEAGVSELRAALLDKENHYWLRSTAASTLADLDELEPVLTIVADDDEDARTREGAMDALRGADADGERVMTLARRIAVDETQPYGVRGSALRYLGSFGDEGVIDILKMALDDESRDDEIRQAAVRGLRDLDEARCLDLVIPLTREGVNNRTRAVAVGAVGDLGHHDPERAYDAVAPLLTDQREARVRGAAAGALVDIEDERGVETLRRLARTHEHPVHRERCAEAADALAAALRSGESDSDLRKRIEELEREVEELKAAPAD